MRKLEPREELAFLQEIYGREGREKILAALINSYDTLQSRAQTLMGLVTIILTIAGFSGPSVARSGPMGRIGVSIGLSLVLASAILTLSGVLQLRWVTQQRENSIEESFVSAIERRNRRTTRYHISFVVLVLGLVMYVSGLISYLFTLSP